MNKADTLPQKKYKRICLVTESTENLSVLSLAQVLTKFNCTVDVIALKQHAHNFQPERYDFDIHILKTEEIRRPTQKFKRLGKYLTSLQDAKHLKRKMLEIGADFDLIVSNMYLAHIACKRLNMPNTYYCIHSIVSSVIDSYCDSKIRPLRSLKKKLYLHLIKKLYNKQNLITVSDGIKLDLMKLGVQPKTIQTIYNPIDFETELKPILEKLEFELQKTPIIN